MSPRATEFFRRLARGEVEAVLTDSAIQESVFTLERTYRIERRTVAEGMQDLIGLGGIVFPAKERLRKAFALYASTPLSFADAYISAVTLELQHPVVGFDRHFDRVVGLRRLES